MWVDAQSCNILFCYSSSQLCTEIGISGDSGCTCRITCRWFPTSVISSGSGGDGTVFGFFHGTPQVATQQRSKSFRTTLYVCGLRLRRSPGATGATLRLQMVRQRAKSGAPLGQQWRRMPHLWAGPYPGKPKKPRKWTSNPPSVKPLLPLQPATSEGNAGVGCRAHAFPGIGPLAGDSATFQSH